MNAPAKPPQTNTMDAATWGLLILLSMLWGGSFLFGRIAVLEITPLNLVFFRVSLAAIALWFWLLVKRGIPTIPTGFVLSIAGMAVLNNIIPFSMISYGQQEIGSGLAAIINAMTPIWTVIIAHFFTQDEKLTASKILGIAVSFAGVAILIGADLIDGLASSALAQLAVLVATISYGLASVYGKRFKGQDTYLVATGQLTASTVMMTIIVIVTGSIFQVTMPSLAAFGSVIGIAILSTAIAYVLFFLILARAGATNVSLVTFLIPVSAIMLGMVFLGETLTPRQLLGMGLILLGLIILDGRILRRFRRD